MGSAAATLFITNSGRGVDLYDPRSEDIDFDDIAEHLSKEARFNGGTPDEIYFVGQHLVLGSRWLLAQAAPLEVVTPTVAWGNINPKTAARYFLTHDFEEYVFRDEVTPKKRALDRVTHGFGIAQPVIAEAYAELNRRMNRAIHAAAGLDWPPPPEIAAAVDWIDRRILVAEWRTLKANCPLPEAYRDVLALPVAIEPWPWRVTRRRLKAAMLELLPVFQRQEVPFR